MNLKYIYRFVFFLCENDLFFPQYTSPSHNKKISYNILMQGVAIWQHSINCCWFHYHFTQVNTHIICRNHLQSKEWVKKFCTIISQVHFGLHEETWVASWKIYMTPVFSIENDIYNIFAVKWKCISNPKMTSTWINSLYIQWFLIQPMILTSTNSSKTINHPLISILI